MVPVGAVESCISGTPVGAWTPSNTSATSGGGVLWEQHMVTWLSAHMHTCIKLINAELGCELLVSVRSASFALVLRVS